MRIVGRLVPLVLAFVLAVFLAPVGSAVAAPAEVQRYYTLEVFFNSCNGEIVTGEARVHLGTKTQKDGSFIQHYNIKGSGTGNQGNEYEFSYHDKITRTPLFDYQEDLKLKVVSKGAAPNYTLILHFDSLTGGTFESKCTG